MTLETSITKLRKAIKDFEDYQQELVNENVDRHWIIMMDAQLAGLRAQLAVLEALQGSF